jgi:hypothetical protein
MKFGGTSVATREGRASIARRISESVADGSAPVVVVSAMGRRGAPYATDTLLELIDGLPANAHERDLLMSCGEVVSAVVVAHELRSTGVDARAYTGPEAGICTDGVIQADCQGENLIWTKGAACSQVDCPATFQAIPTVSEWGLVVLALLLLVGAKVYFGRREAICHCFSRPSGSR